MKKKLIAGTAAGAGALLLYTRYAKRLGPPLQRAIDSRLRTLEIASGTLGFYQDVSSPGAPLVLIHSINAAASSYEMRPLFERFRGVRPVYAVDLPGFGFSDRTDRVYSPELYASAIREFLLSIGPADVVALSLGGEFCGRAALERPDLFRSLTLISPTGFGSGETRGGSDLAYLGFAFPLWTQVFYSVLVSRASIRYFLQKSFAGPVDRGLEDYAYATSHQRGARFAPLYFISGKLFTPQVRDSVWARLSIPVQVLYDRDGYVSFEQLPGFLAKHENWRAVRIPGTFGLPQFERPEEVSRALEEFWTTCSLSPQ